MREVSAAGDWIILNFYPILGSEGIQRLDLGPPAILVLRIISAVDETQGQVSPRGVVISLLVKMAVGGRDAPRTFVIISA